MSHCHPRCKRGRSCPVYRDIPFDLARARKYAILPGRDGWITVEDAVVITVAAVPGGEGDRNEKGADGIAERERLYDRGGGVNAADHPAEFRAQKPARSRDRLE